MIKQLDFYIKSTKSNEFILYDQQGKDTRLLFPEREDFLNLLKMMFIRSCKDRTLKVYGIENSSLKGYIGNSKKANFDMTPDEQFRLHDEEMKCAADVKAA